MPRVDHKARISTLAKEARASGQLTAAELKGLVGGKVSDRDVDVAKAALANARREVTLLKADGASARKLSAAEEKAELAKQLLAAVKAGQKAETAEVVTRPSTGSGKGASTPTRPSNSTGKGGGSAPSRPSRPSRPSTGSGKGMSTPTRPSNSTGKGGGAAPARPARPSQPSRPSTGSGKGGSSPAPVRTGGGSNVTRPSVRSGKGG